LCRLQCTICSYAMSALHSCVSALQLEYPPFLQSSSRVFPLHFRMSRVEVFLEHSREPNTAYTPICVTRNEHSIMELHNMKLRLRVILKNVIVVCEELRFRNCSHLSLLLLFVAVKEAQPHPLRFLKRISHFLGSASRGSIWMRGDPKFQSFGRFERFSIKFPPQPLFE
jgi:hypothetical protein